MNIFLQLEDYLAQWFVNDMGGENPVKLHRGSMESALLEKFLSTPPKGYIPTFGEQTGVYIELPNFRSKDTRSNYYLPPRAADALKACIRTRFDIVMWKELHRFVALFKRQDEMIYAFMEKYGIEQTEKNWNAIAKRYKRKRDIYSRTMRRKKNTKK